MSDERRDALIAGGRQAMSQYFSGLGLESAPGVDVVALDKALEQADRIATGILQP
jgi:hypothetical protein